jgi:succinoglycan biosynthesis transport protein ExoP
MKNEREKRAEGAMPEITLRDVTAPLFRHKKMLLVSFCTVFVLATIVAWAWAARYYQADMQVVVEQDRSDPAITAAQVANVNNNKPITLDQVTSEVALLQGEDMLRKVVSTCELVEPDSWSVTDIFLPSDKAQRQAMKEESSMRSLSKKIKVEAATTSDVIDVKYGRVGAPEKPACVLQTLGKLYLEKHLLLQRPAGSSDFFAQETEKYHQALEASEKRLTDFSKSEKVAAPDILRGDMAQQLAMSEANLYQTQQAIAADQKRIDNVKAQLAATPARSNTSEVSNASFLLMQNLQAELLAAQVKRTQLALKFDPTYPLVKEADEEIAETKDAIAKAEQAKYVNTTTDRDPTYEFLRQDEAKTEADLAAQRASAAALVGSIRGMQTEMVKLDGQAVTQAALQREAKADEGNYLLYLGKREQERTSDALDLKRIANVAIAVPAVTPLLPKYSPFLVMFLGLFAAGFVAIASAYVMEYLDPSFRTPQEVSETLRMPVLATMPKKAA